MLPGNFGMSGGGGRAISTSTAATIIEIVIIINLTFFLISPGRPLFSSQQKY